MMSLLLSNTSFLVHGWSCVNNKWYSWWHLFSAHFLTHVRFSLHEVQTHAFRHKPVVYYDMFCVSSRTEILEPCFNVCNFYWISYWIFHAFESMHKIIRKFYYHELHTLRHGLIFLELPKTSGQGLYLVGRYLIFSES